MDDWQTQSSALIYIPVSVAFKLQTEVGNKWAVMQKRFLTSYLFSGLNVTGWCFAVQNSNGTFHTMVSDAAAALSERPA